MTTSKNQKAANPHRRASKRRPHLDCAPPPPRRDLTISEWCSKHRVSRFLFYKMLKEGTAPRTMKLRKRRTISSEADEAWRQERERETETAS
jgi:predicted DNA-binding transcriptional regulator AlpA